MVAVCPCPQRWWLSGEGGVLAVRCSSGPLGGVLAAIQIWRALFCRLSVPLLTIGGRSGWLSLCCRHPHSRPALVRDTVNLAQQFRYPDLAGLAAARSALGLVHVSPFWLVAVAPGLPVLLASTLLLPAVGWPFVAGGVSLQQLLLSAPLSCLSAHGGVLPQRLAFLGLQMAILEAVYFLRGE